MKATALFDLEGTLIQTPWEDMQHVLKFRSDTKRKLLELGIPSNLLHGIERSTLMRNKAAEYVERNFAEKQAKRFHDGMEEFLKRSELSAVENSKLFPETISAMNSFKNRKFRIGMVTNTSRVAVDTALRLHGLGGYFEVVVTRNDVKKLKPDPEGVLLAVKKLGAKHFFLIGDLALDIQAAHSAKGTAILVDRGQYDDKLVRPDYLVQSLDTVPSIIQTAAKRGKQEK